MLTIELIITWKEVMRMGSHSCIGSSVLPVRSIVCEVITS